MRKNNPIYDGTNLVDLKELFMLRGKSPTTATTYASNLLTYLTQIGGNNLEYFKNTKASKVIEDIARICKTQTSKRRNILSSILALYDYDPITTRMYRDAIHDINETVNEQYKDQEPTAVEKENWVSQEDIKGVYDNLKARTESLRKKDILDEKDILDIQEYVVLSLYVLIPPRRLMDYTQMVFNKPFEQSETVNFIDWAKKQLVFNIYKTSKKYEQQLVDIPSTLLEVLEMWRDINTYRLIEGEATPVIVDQFEQGHCSRSLNELLHKIFNGKKVSCNILRHSFVTDFLASVPSFRTLESTAKNMAHSPATAMLVYKKNI